MRLRSSALLACGAIACSADPEAIPGVQVRMDFTERAGFYDAPFPSDHRRESDGRVRLDGFPDPERIEFVRDLRSVIAQDARGFGLTSGIYLSLTGAVRTATPASFAGSAETDAPIFLMDVDEAPGPDGRRNLRYPIAIRLSADGGPFGAPHLLSLLPLQGTPLRPGRRHAAVVLRSAATDDTGQTLGVSRSMRALIEDVQPDGMSDATFAVYRGALEELVASGVDVDAVAGLAVFTTDDPTATFYRARDQLLAEAPPSPEAALEMTEVYDDYCVFAGTIHMPDFQAGEPPFDDGGGAWAFDAGGRLELQRSARANIVVTVPRRAMPAGGFPTVVFIRTGGGGDRPLVDRGRRADPGGDAVEPGSGPARDFARVGFAGVSVDGPHGGLRNVSGGDEQLLIFNFFNPVAMRDNLRQSALEIVLLGEAVAELTMSSTACAGAPSTARLNGERLALMGHSMGATIAPLALAAQPRYRAAILSGAGGSWIENVIHKRSPLPVRPLAELVLRYERDGRRLEAHDPVLSLLQWAGEPADPPVYARAVVHAADVPRHVLMLQGVVDTYILPSIANALSLSLGLDLAGAPLESTLEALLPLSGRGKAGYPVSANVDGASGPATAVVVQHREDGVEDGHEVVFQTEPPKQQYRCFLETWAAGGAPTVVAPGAPCP